MIYVKEALTRIGWLRWVKCGYAGESRSYVNRKHAAALISGTAAIHLELKWLGIKEGDFVFAHL